MFNKNDFFLVNPDKLFGFTKDYQNVLFKHSPNPLSNKLYCQINYIENSDFVILRV